MLSPGPGQVLSDGGAVGLRDLDLSSAKPHSKSGFRVQGSGSKV